MGACGHRLGKMLGSCSESVVKGEGPNSSGYLFFVCVGVLFFFFFYGIAHLNTSLFKSKFRKKKSSVHWLNNNMDSMKILAQSKLLSKELLFLFSSVSNFHFI